MLNLIFSTIARSVNVASIGAYWFVIVSAIGVLGTSFLTATLLGYIIKIDNPIDFASLRVSVTFPNIVGLPILIFPSLCEFEVVYKGFTTLGDDATIDEMRDECTDQSNTMIFCYFFMWSFLFWSVGHRSLMDAANKRRKESLNASSGGQDNNSNNNDDDDDDEEEESVSLLMSFWRGLKRTFTSPGLIAMSIGFTVACIPPLQRALFTPGGALRFFGAASETLGLASSPIATMVVAASLVSSHREQEKPKDEAEDDQPNKRGITVHQDNGGVETTDTALGVEVDIDHDEIGVSDESDNGLEQNVPVSKDANESLVPRSREVLSGDDTASGSHATASSLSKPKQSTDEPVFMSDPNFGPWQRRRSSVMKVGRAIRRSSSAFIQKMRRTPPEMKKLHAWFILSRLFISPALVCAAIAGMECGGLLTDVPSLAKLVVIINAALPGALIVVVLLKANSTLSESAAVVAKVYLPSYLLSIFTIAAWAAVGLIISLPSEDGSSFCSAR